MGVAPDHLRRDAAHNLGDGERAAVLRQLGVQYHLQEQIAQLARAIKELELDREAEAHLAGPVPKWWKLPTEHRREPLSRLHAWVEQVYRPGYGHLAATLGPCWEAHDLCLYGLDILAELWSVLYLQDQRNAGLLSAQAEYQARILPALSAQFMAETTGCGHARPGSLRARSAP